MSPSWSNDSKRLIFASEQNGDGDVVVASITGNQRNTLWTLPSDDTTPSFSPNGQKIAFSSNRDGNYEIYVSNANGNAPQRITHDPARDTSPAWYPDGSRIVFMSSRGGAEFDLYRMNADGSNVEALTTGGSHWFPQVSPDGANIAFHKVRDVYVMNAQSRIARRVTYEPSNGMHPSWAPDGRQLAFMSWRNGRTEIFTSKADGSDQQLLVSMPSGDAVDPSWSPNGRHIAFVHVTGKPPSERRAVYIVDVETKRLTRISR